MDLIRVEITLSQKPIGLYRLWLIHVSPRPVKATAQGGQKNSNKLMDD